MEHIPLKAMLDGHLVAVEGWMYVFACALRGVPWAVEEASKPHFRPMVLERLRETAIRELEENVAEKFERILKFKTERSS